jgi:hypothetical protein
MGEKMHQLSDQFVISGDQTRDLYAVIAGSGVSVNYGAFELATVLLNAGAMMTQACFFKLPARGFAVVNVYRHNSSGELMFQYEVFRSRYLHVLTDEEKKHLDSVTVNVSDEAIEVMKRHNISEFTYKAGDGEKQASLGPGEILCCRLPPDEVCNNQTENCNCPSLFGWHAECDENQVVCRRDN